jgi:iron complex transport system substrate-binding protein
MSRVNTSRPSRFTRRSALFAGLGCAVFTVLPLASVTALAADTKAQRVLAIGGAVTEIVYALGEQDRLVGRDSTSSYPPEATALPDVGYIRALSPEGVLSVKPDLILARENNGPREAVEVLKSTGVRWVDVPDTFTLAGIDENITIIAGELGVEEKGEALKRKVAEDIARARKHLASVENRRKVMFVLALTDDKVNASGTGTAASNIIELAGAENVISEFEGYKQISNEAVINAAPDVILMMNWSRRGRRSRCHGRSDRGTSRAIGHACREEWQDHPDGRTAVARLRSANRRGHQPTGTRALRP